jgi:hypothetical protein
MEQVTFLSPDRAPVQAARIIGRGPRLHFFAEDAVYAADISRP